jgi:Uma2 family endonuclease
VDAIESPTASNKVIDMPVTNPCFIAEVLSKSNAIMTTAKKISAYRTIDSFREYLPHRSIQRIQEEILCCSLNQWLFPRI